MSRYGTAIVKESRRLTEMIGQVLAYGGMESRRKLPHVPVDVANVIDEAIATCRWMADEQSIAIETDVDRALPLVDGDAASLARAVQNLIANAIRHGAAGSGLPFAPSPKIATSRFPSKTAVPESRRAICRISSSRSIADAEPIAFAAAASG